MQRTFQPSQVEMRQIGPRDVAKMMCGMGACGLENRCCSQFLCEFSSISIRMAKEQGISLTPTEITGMCGRLRCCLIYEYEQYTQARSLLPKKNRRVMTPAGEGRVLDQIPLRDAVYVVLMDDIRREFKRSEIQYIDDNGVLTPAMSDEERLTLHEEVPVTEAPVEEEPPATYTLPPQRRQESDRSQQGPSNRRDGGQNRPQAPRGSRPKVRLTGNATKRPTVNRLVVIAVSVLTTEDQGGAGLPLLVHNAIRQEGRVRRITGQFPSGNRPPGSRGPENTSGTQRPVVLRREGLIHLKDRRTDHREIAVRVKSLLVRGIIYEQYAYRGARNAGIYPCITARPAPISRTWLSKKSARRGSYRESCVNLEWKSGRVLRRQV